MLSGYDIHSSPWYRWPIEIDGLPNLKIVDLFYGKLLNNQRVTLGDLMGLDNGILMGLMGFNGIFRDYITGLYNQQSNTRWCPPKRDNS